jgi:hypothetical protein
LHDFGRHVIFSSMKSLYLVLLLLVTSLQNCSDQLISRQDILDLLENDGSSAGSNAASSDNSSNNQNNTPISNSQNLDYHGLTNSSTGTTTGGAVGYPAGANPTGR